MATASLHEKTIIKAFFITQRARRYFSVMGKSKKRREWLDALNHRPGLREDRCRWLSKVDDPAALLAVKGAAQQCYLLSADPSLDRREMSLEDALREVRLAGWGTIIGLIPGELAYYYGENGTRHALLVV